MADPGSARGENPDERQSDLVRPYVRGPEPPAGAAPPPGEVGPHTFSFLEPAAPPERPTAAPVPLDPPGARHRAFGPAGRHRRFPAARRRVAVIGAVAVITALAGAVFLSLSDHPATARASKCRPAGCHPIVASAPASAGSGVITPTAFPSVRPATAAQDSTRSAATGSATPPASVTAAPAPSATATVIRSTPSPTASGAPYRISIQATTPCCTSFYLRHDDGDNRVVITQITPGSAAMVKADATWIVQSGLANRSCVSFESANDPGDYLRHFDFELYLDPNDGSAQFAQDATFCPQVGNSGEGYSFQSVNYPQEYIRHYDYVVYIASDGGAHPWDAANLWADDSTWLVGQAWGS